MGLVSKTRAQVNIVTSVAWQQNIHCRTCPLNFTTRQKYWQGKTTQRSRTLSGSVVSSTKATVHWRSSRTECPYSDWFKENKIPAHRTLVLHIFWAPYRTKCLGCQFFYRTQCPDDAQIVHQTRRKQNLWLWTKQEKLKFTSLTISPGTAAAKWLLIMNLLSVQLYSIQRKSTQCFDSALYMATYFSQNIVPLRSICTGQHVCLLHWTGAWILLGNNSRLVHSTMKTMGHKTTRIVF